MILASVTSLFALLLLSSGAVAQVAVIDLGSNPPGGARGQEILLTPVIKDQRVPIATLPFTIDEPGSYYLVKDLTGAVGQDGITVVAAHVTLDLNGFSLIGVDGSRDGILVQNDNVTIMNGTVRSWSGAGVDGEFADNGVLRQLRLSGNAFIGQVPVVSEAGCCVRDGWLIEDTLAFGNGGSGIRAEVAAVVRNSTARSNIGSGIQAVAAAIVLACSVADNGEGIVVGDGSNVVDCLARSNAEEGIAASGNSFVHGCVATANSPNYSFSSEVLSLENHQ